MLLEVYKLKMNVWGTKYVFCILFVAFWKRKDKIINRGASSSFFFVCFFVQVAYYKWKTNFTLKRRKQSDVEIFLCTSHVHKSLPISISVGNATDFPRVLSPGLEVLKCEQRAVVKADWVRSNRLVYSLLKSFLLKLHKNSVRLLSLCFSLLCCLPPVWMWSRSHLVADSSHYNSCFSKYLHG